MDATPDQLEVRFKLCVDALRAHGEATERTLKPHALLYLVRHLEHNVLIPLLGREALPEFIWRDGVYRRGGVDSPAEGYDRLAAVYDDVTGGGRFSPEEEHIDAAVGDPAGRTILDVGCGTGRHTLRLAERGANMIGVDVSPLMIEQAQANAAARKLDIKWIVADVLDAPIEPASIDIVISSLAISHVADLAAFFARMRALTKPTARIVLSDIHPCSQMMGTVAGLPAGEQWVQMRLHTHAVSEYFEVAPAHGFRVTNIAEYPRDTVLPMFVLIVLDRD